MLLHPLTHSLTLSLMDGEQENTVVSWRIQGSREKLTLQFHNISYGMKKLVTSGSFFPLALSLSFLSRFQLNLVLDEILTQDTTCEMRSHRADILTACSISLDAQSTLRGEMFHAIHTQGKDYTRREGDDCVGGVA